MICSFRYYKETRSPDSPNHLNVIADLVKVIKELFIISIMQSQPLMQ